MEGGLGEAIAQRQGGGAIEEAIAKAGLDGAAAGQFDAMDLAAGIAALFPCDLTGPGEIAGLNNRDPGEGPVDDERKPVGFHETGFISNMATSGESRLAALVATVMATEISSEISGGVMPKEPRTPMT